jgi:uncharacterized protein (DUF2336 family)
MLPLSDYLTWVKSAPSDKRAQGARLLARAYSHGNLCPEEEHETELALLMVLDDPDLSVRQALADELSHTPRAPHSVLYGLVCDHPALAGPILENSQMLNEDEIIECIQRGNEFTQQAIANRAQLSHRLLLVLAEHAHVDPLLSLMKRSACSMDDSMSPSIVLSEDVLERILKHHGASGSIREALLCQPNLSPLLRFKILKYNNQILAGFITQYKWVRLERSRRFMQELMERAILLIAASSALDQMPSFIKGLEDMGHLTPRLLMRAILSHAHLFTAALFAYMTRVSIHRVFVILADGRAACLQPLLERTSIPELLRQVFLIAMESLASWASHAKNLESGVNISAMLVARIISRCDQEIQGIEKDKILHFLHYFEREAFLEEARLLTEKSTLHLKENPSQDISPVLVLRYGLANIQ